jgi:hypothetical protein
LPLAQIAETKKHQQIKVNASTDNATKNKLLGAALQNPKTAASAKTPSSLSC